MKIISDFARPPELVKITLDSEEIRSEFGDEVTFWMKDFVDINTYFEFFRAQSEDSQQLSKILEKLILNDQGQPALKEGNHLPAILAVAALNKISETLGKSKTKPLMNETGNQPA